MFTERAETGKVFNTSSLWTFLTFCLFWTSVQGQYHLIGSEKPIIAAPGDDVILLCRVNPGWDAERKTVEWSKLDPKVDSSDGRRGVEYVFVYRFQSPDLDIMTASYIQRTSLSSEGLKRGDVSLKLRNVTPEDTGRFRCFIPNLKIDTEVLLRVVASDSKFVGTTPTEMPENRNRITPDLRGETDGTAESRSHYFFLPAVFVFIIVIVIACLSGYSARKKKTESPALDPESRTSPKAQLPCSEAEDCAGSDHQDPFSSSDIRLDMIPDPTRPHG